MRLPPPVPNPELEHLLRRSAEIVVRMTPAQRAEMVLRQRISWVHGEMGIEHPDWSDENLADLPEAWALAEIDRLRAEVEKFKRLASGLSSDGGRAG